VPSAAAAKTIQDLIALLVCLVLALFAVIYGVAPGPRFDIDL